MRTMKETQKLRLARIAAYWSKRCELAEKCLENSPCDPDVTKGQIIAYSEYNDFIKNNLIPS